MKVVVTGSLGNISLGLAKKLIANGHEVTIISSNAQKAPGIEKLKATPAIGSLADVAFVGRAFLGADAVYTMAPPDFSTPDYFTFADTIHRNYARAIEENNIRHVVNLSSIAVARAGVEPLERFYDLEKRLDAIPGLNVVHLRPAMFYTNFYGSLEMVKTQGIMGHNVAGTVGLPMTHPADIAEIAFDFLNTASFNGSQTKYVISDVKTGNEIAALIGQAIGKRVNWIEFPDEALLQGLLQNGFSKDAAETLVVSSGKAIRGGLFDEFRNEVYRANAATSFEEFAKEYARHM
jgi:uncharacterized protein YbjT (DUF2867 family)